MNSKNRSLNMQRQRNETMLRSAHSITAMIKGILGIQLQMRTIRRSVQASNVMNTSEFGGQLRCNPQLKLLHAGSSKHFCDDINACLFPTQTTSATQSRWRSKSWKGVASLTTLPAGTPQQQQQQQQQQQEQQQQQQQVVEIKSVSTFDDFTVGKNPRSIA